MKEDIPSAHEQAMDPHTDLAVERTELALERTHLAWIRTLFTIKTAGLALDKIFEALRKQKLVLDTAIIGQTHFLGLILILFGTLMMIIETWFYIKRSRQLAAMKKHGKTSYYTAAAMGILVIIVGFVFCFLIVNS